MCEAADGSHGPVLQQRAVVDSSTSVQKVPEHGGCGAAVSSVALLASGHNKVFFQRAIGLKAPIKQEQAQDVNVMFYVCRSTIWVRIWMFSCANCYLPARCVTPLCYYIVHKSLCVTVLTCKKMPLSPLLEWGPAHPAAWRWFRTRIDRSLK